MTLVALAANVQVLEARRGRWRFDRSLVRLADASNYVGLQISNSLVTYLLVLLASALAAVVITWPLIIKTLLQFWRFFLALVLPAIINVAFKKVFGYTLLTRAKPDRIVHRRWYMLYDVVQVFVSFFTGITTALVRMIVAMVFVVLTLPRMVRARLRW
jgi:hypothetical protein